MQRNVHGLRTQGFQAVAVDVPGHGLGDKVQGSGGFRGG